MNGNFIKKYTFGILFLIFSFFFLATNSFAIEILDSEMVAARVMNVEQVSQSISNRIEDTKGYRVISIEKMSLKILEGKQKGVIHSLENTITSNSNNIIVERGDKVLVQLNKFDNGTYEVIIKDSYRVSTFYFFGILFLLLMVFVFRTSVLKIFLLFAAMSGGFYWFFHLLLNTNQAYLFFLPLISIVIVSSFLLFGHKKNAYLSMIASLVGTSIAFFVYTFLKPSLIDRGLISLFNLTEYNFEGILFVSMLSMIIWTSLFSSKLTILSLEHLKEGKKSKDFTSYFRNIWHFIKIRMLYVFVMIMIMFLSLLSLFVNLMQEGSLELSKTMLLNQEVFLFSLFVIFILFSALFSTAFLLCYLRGKEKFGYSFSSKQDKLF